jgi:hypothetical protein
MTAPRQRLQVRVTLDSDMGPVFHWAANIPERARARELVAILRVGYAISTGNAGIAGVISTALAGEPDGNMSATRSMGRPAAPILAAGLELRAIEAALDVFDPSAVTGVPPPL